MVVLCSFCLIGIYFSKAFTLDPDQVWQLNYYEGNKTFPENRTRNNTNIGTLYPGTAIEIDWSIESYIAFSNGQNSGIDIDQLSGICLTDLSTCVNGFSLSLWIKWDQWATDFIISSSKFNWKHFTEDTIPIEVWNGEDKAWRLFHSRDTTKKWSFYVITWSKDDGITVFVDGVKDLRNTIEATSSMFNPFNQMKPQRISLGKSAAKVSPESPRPNISLRRFAIWNKQLSEDEVLTVYQQEASPMEFTGISSAGPISYSLFTEHANHTLTGHTFKTIFVQNQIECFEKCTIEYKVRCKSYNFGVQKETKICELNEKRKSDVARWFFTSSTEEFHFNYYEIME
ncbi:uncharacterized protein [Clytia hemisphaerica]|uniref:Apple domain-containing protein n=1 Tax=Clytia hemisphaerica TaxID=252671 RepID=A0A7M5TQH5_9CNID